jgi:ABC-2 type transport system ATP-binding protein
MESVELLCDNIALINNAQKVLDGSLKDIKQRYKQNLFEAVTDSFDTSRLSGYGIEKNEDMGDGKIRLTLRPNSDDTSPNRLLQQLINVTVVHSFTELLPNINDIFISLVKPVAVTQ